MKPLTSYAAELFASIFHYLKLELLTQFPASNNEKYLYLLHKLSIYKKYFIKNCDISIDVKHVLTVCAVLATQWLKHTDNHDTPETQERS